MTDSIIEYPNVLGYSFGRKTTIETFQYNGGISGMICLYLTNKGVADRTMWTATGENNSLTSGNGTGTPFYEVGVVEEVGRYLTPNFYTSLNTTYDLGAPFYNQSKPVTVTDLSAALNTPNISRTIEYEYNTAGLTSKVITDPGTTEVVTTEYTYDATFGNLIKEETYAASMPTITTEYTYSPDGRFLIQKENTLGYTDDYTYDGWGNMLTHTGPDGLTTTYVYDEIGRLVETTLPSTIVITNIYDWASSSSENPTTLNPTQFVKTTTTSGRAGASIEFFDYYKRKVRDVYPAFDGQLIYQDVKYKINGLVDYTTTPYYKTSSGTANTTTFTYDAFDRETLRTTSGGGATITTSYTTASYSPYLPQQDWHLKKTITNTTTSEVREVSFDASNTIMTGAADDHGSVFYSHNADRSIAQTSNQGLYTNYFYDAFQRLEYKTEPNVGTTEYEYDKYDRLVEEEDANGNTTEYTYDDLGRVVEKQDPSGIYTYTYENTTGIPATGKLKEETGPNGAKLEYSYDGLGRLASIQETIAATGTTIVFSTSYSYNDYGQKRFHTYPTGDVVEYVYNSYGHLSEVLLAGSSRGLMPQKLWQRNGKNHLGLTTQTEYYDAANAPIYTFNKTYNAFGMPVYRTFVNNLSTNALSHWLYDFDIPTGNLNSREDLNRSLEETFTYDLGDRLTDVALNGTPSLNIRYDGYGNTLGKSDATNSIHDWMYNDYALVTVPEPNLTLPDPYRIPMNRQEVEYWSFNKVKVLRELNANEIEFYYAPDLNRNVAIYRDLSGPPPGVHVKTRFYGTSYERTIDASNNDEELCYVSAGGELIAIFRHSSTAGSANPSKIYYVVTDHLGSITHIMDNDGTSFANGLVEERSFDAWGRPRDPANWLNYPLPTATPGWMFDRGYTGHEHIWLNGTYDNSVINMNGRLYDPLVGRMFSPDPVKLDVERDNNKYSYARNNPLKYTDPSGEFVKAAFFVSAFLGEFVGNLATGQSNAFGAAVSQASSATSQVGSALQVPLYSSQGYTVSAGIDPFGLGLSVNYSGHSGNAYWNANVGFGFGGPSGGAGLGYKSGNFAVNAGASTDFSSFSFSGGAFYDDGKFSLGYYQSYYGGNSDAALNQWSGGIAGGFGDLKFRQENDFLAFGHRSDKGRTQAWEVSYGNIAVGSYIHTNDGKNESNGTNNLPSRIFGLNKHNLEAWYNGQVKAAPLYFGYNGGGTTSRIGWNDWWVQDIQQNGLHQSAFRPGNQNYYLDYSKMGPKVYLQQAYYNRFSLYGF